MLFVNIQVPNHLVDQQEAKEVSRDFAQGGPSEPSIACSRMEEALLVGNNISICFSEYRPSAIQHLKP